MNHGKGYGYGNGRLYQVIRSEKIADYKKLMNDFEDDSLHLKNCDGVFKVGCLYAVERNKIMYVL